MAYYRLYFMDGPGGHITRFEQFEAGSDALALAAAEAQRGAAPLELWCERRMVGRWEALWPPVPPHWRGAGLPT